MSNNTKLCSPFTASFWMNCSKTKLSKPNAKKICVTHFLVAIP